MGLLDAFALSRVLGTLLFEVRAGDPVIYFTVGVMLGLVALIVGSANARTPACMGTSRL
jgi:hypothetical protein